MQDLFFILRIILAACLGFIIGFERKKRAKEAGIRTHAIVAAGACLITVVSKYGFSGDGARVAAQIVSGIGFIGAGMIFFKQGALSGLTTAAGIWTTAGVGMASGAGMYTVAVGATAVILCVQIVMHLPIGPFKQKRLSTLRVVFISGIEGEGRIKSIFAVDEFTSLSVERFDGELLRYTVGIETDNRRIISSIAEILQSNDFIITVESVDNEF